MHYAGGKITLADILKSRGIDGNDGMQTEMQLVQQLAEMKKQQERLSDHVQFPQDNVGEKLILIMDYLF